MFHCRQHLLYELLLCGIHCLGGGKGSDSDDDEPAAKKKPSPALVRTIIFSYYVYYGPNILIQSENHTISDYLVVTGVIELQEKKNDSVSQIFRETIILHIFL